VCFPECFVPGYRGLGRTPPAVDAAFLERAWDDVGVAAARARVAVVLGTERIADGRVMDGRVMDGRVMDGRVMDGRVVPSALVIDEAGARQGFQDKVQLDPSEEETYAAGRERRMFRAGGLVFGVAICHEAWRYPETVRWAARRGAQVVFHPQFHAAAEPGAFVPQSFADPRNSFHESAMLCRAAENDIYFASVNYAVAGSTTTSAVASPDGRLLCHQPYGQEGLLAADIDTDQATGLLARRYKPLD
jgi:predicted amidohydrolase